MTIYVDDQLDVDFLLSARPWPLGSNENDHGLLRQ